MDINITIRFEGLDNLANALSDIAGCRAAVHLAEMTGQKTLPEKKAAPVMEGTPVSAKKEREIRDVLKTAAPSDVKAEPKKEAAKPDDTIPREELAGIRQKIAAYIKAHPENGKATIKQWLTEHDAAGISKVLVKDRAALVAFLEGGEKVA